MEYMMIRSLKSGGNPDASTPTLSMIPDHHVNHNNHLQHQQQQTQQQNNMQGHHQQQQQQRQQQQQQQSLVEQQVNDLYTAMNCDDLNNSTATNDSSSVNWNTNIVGGDVPLQQPVAGSSNIPILFKSSEIYERIVASTSVSSQSNDIQLSNFGGAPSSNHHKKNENLYEQMQKNHVTVANQQFVVPGNYQSNQFQSGQTISTTSIGRPTTVKKAKMKLHKGKRKLWEYSFPNSSVSRLESSTPTESSSAQTSNTVVPSSSRKRKFSSSSISTSFQMNKRPRTSLVQNSSAVTLGGSKVVNKSSLCSQMPNLFRAFHESDNVGSDKFLKSDSIQAKLKKLQRKLAVVPSRPKLPKENIFLKKYDPIRLLTRLCATTAKSETVTNHATKILVEDKFPRMSRHSPKKSETILNTNPLWPSGQNIITNTVQSSRLSSFSHNAYKPEASGKPSALAALSAKRSKSKSKHLRDNGVVIKRKSSKKSKQKPQRKYPKYVKPKRKLNVRFLPSKKGVRQLRARVLAAIFLQRAIARLRSGRGLKERKYTKLRKAKRSHKRHDPKPVETTAPIQVLKKGKETNSLKKFKIAKIKMPKPLPIRTVKLQFNENQYLYNTIELLRHKRELEDRMDDIDAEGVVYRLDPIPEREEPERNHLVTKNFLLKRRQVKQIISEKLTISIAHAGFTHTTIQPIELTADLVADFLMKATKRLKEVCELEVMGIDHGFPDPMERVLVEMGMGGIRSLEDFYRTKIDEHGQRMVDQCKLLRRQFATKVRSKVGLGNSTSTSSTTTPTTATTIVTASSGGSGSRPVINTSKTASTSSSQPLSPGNSMLASMLAVQEEATGRTTTMSSSTSLGEKQLEDLMIAPPNVEIRPNSYHSRQQLPLHQLLASLSQQSHQQAVAQPQLVRAGPPSAATSPVVLNQAYHQPHQHQQAQQNVLQASTPPQYPVGNQNTNHHLHHHHQNLQPSSQGLQHSQPHLTQLLQRPITNQQSPTNHHPAIPTQAPHHHVVIQSPGQAHQSQYQGVPLAAPQVVAQRQQNSSNQVNQLRSGNLNSNNNRPLLAMPIQISLGKQGHQSPSLKTEIPSTVPAAQSPSLKQNTKAKTVTIIRSNSASSPGIILSNDRPPSNSGSGAGDVLPEFSSPLSGSNVISINLGSNSIDLDHSNVPQTVTMHAADSGIAAGGVSTGSSKAKLKEAINQRNLLRLNFEQVPSAGESTVLLSSSSAPVANATGNVQFVGKVTPGQTITWNTNYQ
ncbi:unnamed protein product [Orchesella dallaii]|uniref:Uncharacterized protein n=1 Tax=Orchesella dallaii TaxID=48710 RepID=A0ABP1QL54_9HEXA